MPQLVQVGRMMGASPVAGIRPVAYEAESLTYFTALAGAGETLTDARKYTINRQIKRLKDGGIWSKVSWGYAFSADAFALDATGRLAVTKNGTPTFSNNAVSTASNANYYEIDKEFQAISPTNHCMGFLARTGSAANAAYDMGATDGSTLLAINSKFSTGSVFRAASFTGSISMGTSALAAGSDFNAINRRPGDSGSFYNYVRGINRASSATAAGSTTSTNKIQVLKLGGGTTPSSRSIAAWFLGDGLTHDEMCLFYAVLKSIDNAVVYGEPQIQDAGYGDAVVYVDAVINGLSMAAVNAAYEATRHGRVIALVGEERDTSPEHIGFNPVSWVDAHDPLTVNGLCRAAITAANTQLGVTDSTDQQGLSVHSMRWNRTARQMLDPTRTAPLDLPGADIKVYLDGGPGAVTMATTAIGRECTEFRSKCGRIFRPLNGRMIVVNGDYDCNLAPLLGVSYTLGTEARGPAPGEDLNGYDPDALFPLRDNAANEYTAVDPYVTPATPASGLLPSIIELPSITDGDPDPTLQAMCYRFIATSNANRRAPLTGGATLAPSPDYDPLYFEPVGRLYAAMTANGHTPNINDAILIGHAIEGAGSTVEDWNNGASGFSLDMGQLAGEYLAATTHAARDAAITKLTRYTQDYFYWHLASGDSRIPSSLVTALSAYGADTSWGVDPYPGHPLFFPPYPYRRDPRHQPKNTFNFSGNDTFMADGTTPRSIKTVACGSYRADRHTTRHVNISGAIWRQGGVNDDTAGGVDERIPVPLEVIVPDKAECANFISVAALFCTKIANSSLRMEPVFQLCGQAAGIIIDHALTDEVAVQDIDYPAFRTAFLAIPDAVAPVLPQTN